MSASPILLALVGGVFAVVVTGIFLTRSGHPFSSAILNVHKLVDLALLAAVGIVVYRDIRVATLSTVATASVLFVAGLQLVTLVTGGVVAASQSAPSWVKWAHRIVSWPAVLVTIWWGVLFLA